MGQTTVFLILMFLIIIFFDAFPGTDEDSEPRSWCRTSPFPIKGSAAWIECKLSIDPIEQKSFVYMFKKRSNKKKKEFVVEGDFNLQSGKVDFTNERVSVDLKGMMLTVYIKYLSEDDEGTYWCEDQMGTSRQNGSLRVCDVPAEYNIKGVEEKEMKEKGDEEKEAEKKEQDLLLKVLVVLEILVPAICTAVVCFFIWWITRRSKPAVQEIHPQLPPSESGRRQSSDQYDEGLGISLHSPEAARFLPRAQDVKIHRWLPASESGRLGPSGGNNPVVISQEENDPVVISQEENDQETTASASALLSVPSTKERGVVRGREFDVGGPGLLVNDSKGE